MVHSSWGLLPVTDRILLHTQPFYGSLDFCPGQPGWAGTRRNIHPLLSWSSIIPICFCHLLRSMASSLFSPCALQSFCTISKFSLVYLLTWHPPLHTPYISSPNHCLLFAAHTITTCFAVVLRLCHLILVSLSALLGTLSCNFTPHINLTILISALWSATSFSFITGQVSLPYNILLLTQLLYNLPLTVNDISLLVSNRTNCLNLFHPIR